MKLVTYYIGDNTIEIENSVWGKETIKVNGEIVSQKSSVLGAKHTFQMMENGTTKEAIIKIGYTLYGLQIDLMIDNKPIIENNRSLHRFWILFGIMLSAFIIGFLISKI